MATTLPVRPSRAILNPAGSWRLRPPASRPGFHMMMSNEGRSWWGLFFTSSPRTFPRLLRAASRADDSAPMSVEKALKLLGVSEGASFDDILRAKNSILADYKDDQEAISQVEAAYDMLLMHSLSQRRSGKVVNSSIRYADVKPISTPTMGMGSVPQWLESTVKTQPILVEAPATTEIGIQAGVYGALAVLTYVNGSSALGSYGGADVPGLILATSFGMSLYFITRKNVKLGKAGLITIGGLVAGAVVGSTIEKWLQVDIVPFLGIHSPATIVTEFILVSQFLVSLYLI